MSSEKPLIIVDLRPLSELSEGISKSCTLHLELRNADDALYVVVSIE